MHCSCVLPMSRLRSTTFEGIRNLKETGETVTVRTLIAAALIIGSVALKITAQQLRARVEPALSAAMKPAD